LKPGWTESRSVELLIMPLRGERALPIDARHRDIRGVAVQATRFPPEEMLAELHRLPHAHHRPDFDGTVRKLEDRTTGRQRRRLGEISRLDECIAANDVLGLCKRAVGDGSSPPCHQLAGTLQGVARILDPPSRRLSVSLW
jgi:hypothetical protein